MSVVSRQLSVRAQVRGRKERATDHGQRTERRAITLTEVLISMGILTLGLLGVAAMFPVGSYYMVSAEIADRGSQIAQAAMNDLLARGMLDPRAWRMFDNRPTGLPPAAGLRPYLPNNSFSRPFARALSESLAKNAAFDPNVRQRHLAKQFGHAFVIDPMAVAVTSLPNGHSYNYVVSHFPANAAYLPLRTGAGYWSTQWQPWAGNPNEGTWPVRRVTFAQPGSSNGAVMDPMTAEHFFRGSDDISVDLPDRDDRPAIQTWDTIADPASGSFVPLARQWVGNYSWIATVVPTTSAARDAMATNPESYSYDVTVVAFYKRALGVTVPASSTEMTGAYQALAGNERYVKARVMSASPAGGELLLQALYDGISESPFEQLRAGQWIMLCGPHPVSTDADPRFAMNWYEVIAIEGEGQRLNSDGTTNPPAASGEPQRRLVTLRGPRWPWLPAPTGTSDPNHLSRNLCVAICPGAVAAHRRTIRLEGGTAFGTGAPANSALAAPKKFEPQ